MPRAATIPAIAIAAIGAAWVFPFMRAWRFYCYASEVDASDGSIDAHEDYTLSLLLLVSYGLSLAVAAAIAWLCFRTRAPLLMLPLAGSLFIALDVIRLKPESVIVLIPTMHPFRPLGLSLIVALAAVLILVLHRGSRRSKTE